MRQGFVASGALKVAHAALMARVFDDASGELDGWRMFAAFEPNGSCVGALEVRLLPMCLDGARADLTGVRRVAVDPSWRGLGLFRDLMEAALAWCATQTPYPTLLYTEEPALYTRFGFSPLAQHAFTGPPLAPWPVSRARALDLRRAEDAGLMRRRLDRRQPVSAHCALAGASDLVIPNILAAGTFHVADATDCDAIIVYEHGVEAVTIVDVIAAAMPSMATILGALAPTFNRVTTLFPPDRLGWHGTPQADDTGLMARGPLPPAMTRPFMLPPTAEF